MIVVPVKNKWFSTNIIYLYNNENIDNLPPCDIIDFREAMDRPSIGCSEFYTLITDLTKPEEELFSLIDSGCRYEIRRAKEKDALKIEFLAHNDITNETIETFVKFFNSFADSKGINRCDKKLINFAYNNNALALSFVYEGDNDLPLVAHAYFISNKETRLWYSCSHYREGDTQFRNLVGRANRFLHWQDLIEFKTKCFNILDWGGAGRHEEVANITKFKRSFGGMDATFYNYRLPMSFKGKIINFAKKILRR